MKNLSIARLFRFHSIAAKGKQLSTFLGQRSPRNWLIGSLMLTSPMVLILPAIAQAPTPEKPLVGVIVKVPGGGCLNARKTPSPYGEIYGCIENNSVLKPIINENNGWYQLTSGGWVWKQYTSMASTPTPKPTPKPKPSPTPAQTPRFLSYNAQHPMQGEDVKKLQKKLNEHRVLNHDLVVDGVFGLSTKQAVEALQRRHGLTVDGIAGNAVRSILKL